MTETSQAAYEALVLRMDRIAAYEALVLRMDRIAANHDTEADRPLSDRVKYRALAAQDRAWATELRKVIAAQDAQDARRAREMAAAVVELAKVAEWTECAMYAAVIDIRRGDLDAATKLLGERLRGWDGPEPEWDGTETGAQWLARTREDS